MQGLAAYIIRRLLWAPLILLAVSLATFALGRFGPGTLPLQFEHAIFSLNPGSTSPIVRTEYGYHLFQLVEKIPPRRLPFEEVRNRIEAELTEERAKERYEGWMAGLRSSAKIHIHEGLLGAESSGGSLIATAG